MKREIRLIALDVDGTLFNSKGIVTTHTKEVLRQVLDAGIAVVISTGRPYIGLPFAAMKELGLCYAITANGAGVYQFPERNCLFEDAIAPQEGAVLLKELYRHNLHVDAFINGDAYTQSSTRSFIDKLQISESLRNYIRDTRVIVDDLGVHVVEKQLGIQKLTLNFTSEADGSFPVRDKVLALIQKNYPKLHVVSGGFHNLEITKAGISKAKGLHFLCQMLDIPVEQSMVCGDSENDYDIVMAAGIGVAMANSEQILLDHADYVTKSNDEDGIAYAIEQLVQF